jgi:hypothetical protein
MALCTGAKAQAPAEPGGVRQLDVSTKAWTGDFDGMLERRMIRFYVPYSRSLYFIDKGTERGIAAELVVDDWKAKMWVPVLPKVKLHEGIQLRPKTRIGWAIRKNSPKLAAELGEFYAYYAKLAGGVPRLQRDYMARIKAMKNATASEDTRRLRQLRDYKLAPARK